MSDHAKNPPEIFGRHFTAGEDYEVAKAFPCESRNAEITDHKGRVIFSQDDCLFPVGVSDETVKVVASKYFYGDVNAAKGVGPQNGGREDSFYALVDRVVRAIAVDGHTYRLFSDSAEAVRFGDELRHICLGQYAAFNSPVWFNVGLHGSYGIKGDSPGYHFDRVAGKVLKLEPGDAYRHPQGSACFILSVADDMDSIAERGKTEMLLFKFGSGCGSNNSTLRSELETISGGGRASGPCSFMKTWDAIASVTKSGGKTRRAAKMEILSCVHPDIALFIGLKTAQEKVAQTLIAGGYPNDFNGPAYDAALYQNCNMSVRATDAFMEAATLKDDPTWQTLSVVTGEAKAANGDMMPAHDARVLLRKIAEGTWACGDPGMQFDTTINEWHTCPRTAPINASNPCSEYMFIDDSACNLASINLLKFLRDDGTFDFVTFRHVVRVVVTAQEILVGHSAYPTEKIAHNSHSFRPLGLGYANLGGLLMCMGLPYDSDAGRQMAALVTSVMHGEAYLTSAKIAARIGAFAGYAENTDAMMAVIRKHQHAAKELRYGELGYATKKDPNADFQMMRHLWEEVVAWGKQYGFRNSQVTVLAPTGTIAFMMGCDTTGIEPDIALVKYKSLAGGGVMKIVNRLVPRALKALGYTESSIARITAHIEETGNADGSGIRDEDLAVFDCAFEPEGGGRSLHWKAHIKMMAAVQPFLSGAISKCVVGNSVLATSAGLRRINSYYGGEAPDKFRRLYDTTVPTGDGTMSRASDFYYGGVKPTYRAVLADGREITGTAPHRLRVATPGGLDWKTLPELEPGDFVGLCLGTECWGSATLPEIRISAAYGSQNAFRFPEEMDKDLGTFLGMLTADGHVARSNYVVGFTKDSKEARDKFKELLLSLFGLEGHDVADDRREGGPDGLTGVNVGSKSLMEWLDAVGWSKEGVPACVLGGPRKAAIGYLSGLYLDGYVTKIDDVAIGQKHRSLLLEVQSIWDNLGVATYFTDNFVDEVNYPVLHALAVHRKLMASTIEWIEPHKAARAANVDGEDRRQFPLKRAELEAAVRDKRATQEFRGIFDKRTAVLGRKSFLFVADAVGLELTAEERNLHYVPVVSVDYAGEQEVYDISVPGPESFVANGIVNHNTVNLPNSATVEEIEEAYVMGWKLGLKAVAIYRDGCKSSQPLSTSSGVDEKAPVTPQDASPAVEAPQVPCGREKLPRIVDSQRFKLAVGGMEFYVHVGFYPDSRRPGEVFVTMEKEGSTLGGCLDAIAVLTSFNLQAGTPLEDMVQKFSYTKFDPAGPTGDPDVPMATSILDLLFRKLGFLYVPGYREEHGRDLVSESDVAADVELATVLNPDRVHDALSRQFQIDAPVCGTCGNQTVRSGGCYRCPHCLTSMGCN